MNAPLQLAVGSGVYFYMQTKKLTTLQRYAVCRIIQNKDYAEQQLEEWKKSHRREQNRE
jgi:hypothetical protein